ncbi:MAG: hypothetical protein ABW169_05100 [Sphingobium sp.]
MFAILGAVVFSGAAVFSLVVIVQMVRGYLPLIEAALRGAPMPRSMPVQAYVIRRRRVGPSFTPSRLERARAAA